MPISNLRSPTLRRQAGGTLVGLAVGLLVGLAVALAVAMYVSKVPVPFVDKLPQRSADQDAAETERNRNWNPNAPLSGKTPLPAGTTPPNGTGTGTEGGSGGVATMPATAGGMAPILPPGQGGAAGGANAGAPPAAPRPVEPRVELTGLFIQAGAYSRVEEAEQQRARLAMLGFAARVSEREQGGRSVFRVRVGPFETRDETQGPMDRLMAAGVEVSLVRVERSNTP